MKMSTDSSYILITITLWANELKTLMFQPIQYLNLHTTHIDMDTSSTGLTRNKMRTEKSFRSFFSKKRKTSYGHEIGESKRIYLGRA